MGDRRRVSICRMIVSVCLVVMDFWTPGSVTGRVVSSRFIFKQVLMRYLVSGKVLSVGKLGRSEGEAKQMVSTELPSMTHVDLVL